MKLTKSLLLLSLLFSYLIFMTFYTIPFWFWFKSLMYLTPILFLPNNETFTYFNYKFFFVIFDFFDFFLHRNVNFLYFNSCSLVLFFILDIINFLGFLFDFSFYIVSTNFLCILLLFISFLIIFFFIFNIFYFFFVNIFFFFNIFFLLLFFDIFCFFFLFIF